MIRIVQCFLIFFVFTLPVYSNDINDIKNIKVEGCKELVMKLFFPMAILVLIRIIQKIYLIMLLRNCMKHNCFQTYKLII